jgi:hypothetical protein
MRRWIVVSQRYVWHETHTFLSPFQGGCYNRPQA